MQKKLKELFGSLRFWIVTLTMVTAILEGIVSGEQLTYFLDIVQIYFGTVVGIGTLDSVAKKINYKAWYNWGVSGI